MKVVDLAALRERLPLFKDLGDSPTLINSGTCPVSCRNVSALALK